MKEPNQRTKYRHLIKSIILMEASLSYYQWQVKLRKELGEKYAGPSLSDLQGKVKALEYSLPEFRKHAESQNPNPGEPKRTVWGL